MKLFKQLSPEEEASFRQWARQNYNPLSPIEGIWHPVVQDECQKINCEIFGYTSEDKSAMYGQIPPIEAAGN